MAEEPISQPPPLPIMYQPPPARLGIGFPLMLVTAGIAVIAAMALLEMRDTADAEWLDGLLITGAACPQDAQGLWPLQARQLSLAEGSPSAAFFEGASDDEIALGEHVLCFDQLPEGLGSALTEGRLPEEGKPEALAGDLALRDSFELDGTRFEVVGRLDRRVSGLTYAFVVLESPLTRPLFGEAADALPGWFDPDGLPLFVEEKAPYDSLEDDESVEAAGGATLTLPLLALGTVAGMVLVAVGGALAQMRFLLWLRRFANAPMPAALSELHQRPGLLAGLHIALYGTFFGAMIIGLGAPVENMLVTHVIFAEFSEGSLDYIGEAYASGNILRATGATFIHNYVTATLSYTILPSLLIPFAGFFKSLLTFGAVGFGMAPMWAGAAGGMTFHAITMTLELEAYVLASFVAVVWPLRLMRGLREQDFHFQFTTGLRVMGGGAALTGVMLIIAAFYEATTIILLR